MTSYVNQLVLGTTISPFVSSDKGDLANKANCAGSQIKNNLSTLAQDTLVIGGTAAGAYGISKSDKFAKPLAKGVDYVINGLKNLLPKGKPASKIATTLSPETSKIAKAAKEAAEVFHANNIINNVEKIKKAATGTAHAERQAMYEKLFKGVGETVEKATTKTPEFLTKAKNVIKDTAKGITKDTKSITKKFPNLLEKISKLSPKTKALAVVLGAGAVALGHINHKHYYKMGQIDQKYTDRATVERHMTAGI